MRPGRSRLRSSTAVLSTFVLSAIAALTVSSPAAAAAPADFALARPATSDSAEPGHPATSANDARSATRWSAADAATGHWWQVDLRRVAPLTGSQVVWEFARDYRYRISVSTDGAAWTTAVDRTAGAGSAQTRADAFTAQARYVRITVTGLPAGTWASMVSFSVFGVPAGGTQPYKGFAGCVDQGQFDSSWYYNWWINPGDCTAPGFVPMISGSSTITAGDVSWQLDQVAKAGYKTVLGFNEPNKADQSNMPMAKVLDLWPALTADPSIRVSSPSTSGDGQLWFTDFMKQADARGLRVDFINLHWYGWNLGSCDANALTFENYLKWAEGLPGNRPIWITEFGCLNASAPNPEAVERFYAAAVDMLAKHPRVERHAFYPHIKNHELTAEGALTPLGQIVAYAPAKH